MSPAPGNSVKPLLGQRVLVTRPQHQADNLCAQLEQLGAEPIRFPTLAIQAVDESDPGLKQYFLNLDQYQAVIFISANAARLGYDWIDRYWPQLPIKVNWLAVGSATARTLLQLGLQSETIEGAMDSEALLQHPHLQQLENCKLLICRGQGGREHLGQTLRERGAQVDYAELYQRQMPVYSQTEIESIIYKSSASAMFVSSGEALSNLVDLTRATDKPSSRLVETPLIVPSQRVAKLAEQYHFNHIRVAANATDEAMIQALLAQNAPNGQAE